MAAPSEIPLQFTLADPAVGKGAAKSCAISDGDKPLLWQPAGPLEVAFEPSAYQDSDANRVNLSIRTTPALETAVRAFDQKLLEYCAAHSERLFGKEATLQQLAEKYQSPLKTSEKYPSTLRLKMNWSGRSAVRLWDAFRKAREPPASWTQCAVTARIRIKSVYITNREFGPILEVTDVLVEDTVTAECPF